MDKTRIKIAAVTVALAFGTIGCVASLAIRIATPSFPGFSLKSVNQEDALTRVYEYEGKGVRIRLKSISDIAESEAWKVIDGKIITIEALYGNELSPYPGMISNEIVCSGDLIPKRQEARVGSQVIPYFVASLTNRFTYGNCVQNETPYKGFIAWTFCPERSEYRQMELIYPTADFDEGGVEFIKENICD